MLDNIFCDDTPSVQIHSNLAFLILLDRMSRRADRSSTILSFQCDYRESDAKQRMPFTSILITPRITNWCRCPQNLQSHCRIWFDPYIETSAGLTWVDCQKSHCNSLIPGKSNLDSWRFQLPAFRIWQRQHTGRYPSKRPKGLHVDHLGCMQLDAAQLHNESLSQWANAELLGSDANLRTSCAIGGMGCSLRAWKVGWVCLSNFNRQHDFQLLRACMLQNLRGVEVCMDTYE